MPTVLITEGNARIARHVIEEFLSHPNCPNLRVLVRADGEESLAKAYPRLKHSPHAIAVVEYMDERTLTPAFQNATVVVHNGPAVHQQEVATAISAIDAARNARVQHFVFCSVLHPMRTKLVTHKHKLQIEEYLIESRLNYTILHSPHFMQNVALRNVFRTGKLPLAYSQSIKQGFLDLRDLSHVLRNIVHDTERHNFATYELVGQNLTYDEVAAVLQELVHRNIECEVIPTKKYIEMMKDGKGIQSEYAEDAMERIMMYHNRWGLTGNSNVLRWLLGREPRTWREYAADMLQKL